MLPYIRNIQKRTLPAANKIRFTQIFSRKNHYLSKLSYYHGKSTESLKPFTIGQVFNEVVEKIPDREYIVSRHENKKYTYEQMYNEVDKLCQSFSVIGLRNGDRIGVWMPNCMLYVSITIAAARLGLIIVSINPAFQSDELKHSITLVGVKCLFTMEKFKSQNYASIFENIDPEIWNRPPNIPIKSKVMPTLETIVFNTENNMKGAYNLQSFFDIGVNKNYKVPNVQPDDGCIIQFTSGTTGKPKAALLSHFSIMNNAYFIMKRLGILNDKDIVHKFCCPMPYFHIFALSAGILGALLTESTVYLPSAHFEPKATVDVLLNDKSTIFFGTPTLFVDIMEIIEKMTTDKRENNLKFAITGGAPCSTDLMKKFKRLFPKVILTSIFGMTETSPCTFQNFSNDSEEKILNTVGIIQDHVEAKVINKKSEIVPFGTPGELLIRGYVNMTGYYNQEDKTKEIIDSSRWLHTGDQFILYENGYGHYTGRLKDMIIRGGENIFPKEIEYFLESHPSITQAQVYSIPDERMGEEICASITTLNNVEIKQADIKSYAKGKISHFKVPKYIFTEKTFPKTGSGKIQKFKLKEIATKRIFEMNRLSQIN
ncbi:medium-chain acyl-CoA ligase ACSF2, mitochondrial-like isoform X2 [Daktulosphaira vitifoliae]|uniref:medium-chain acyl-CoA ligase ACSF2, mitochondrial-like isoform X2 n=1 Tax=Daktulosphaira vitifoliae TaxID=58002 RepID=UPI0021AAD0C4|nr:medium-chain acyl-CoA ligase ACSF2, mitochondrial-like isoform X2 [Daktulosphaira vitifoliae]